MPLWTYRDLEAAPSPPASPTPSASLRAVFALVRLDEASRRGIRISPRGLSFHRTIAEAESERERLAMSRLRAGG